MTATLNFAPERVLADSRDPRPASGRRSVEPENDPPTVESESVGGSRPIAVPIAVPLAVSLAVPVAAPVIERVAVPLVIAPVFVMHALVFARRVAVIATMMAPAGAVLISVGQALLPVLPGIAAAIGGRRIGAQTGRDRRGGADGEDRE